MKKFKKKDQASSHGRTTFYIEGVGIVGENMLDDVPIAQPMMAAGGAVAPPAFRFCSMFNLPAFRPDSAGLIELGGAMEDTLPVTSNSTIPAGFTYFGQFVDHDITFDKSILDETGSLGPDDLIQSRSPSLDLDGLYGLGPEVSTELYEIDRVRMKLGMTTNRGLQGPTPTVVANDLPRLPPDDNDPPNSKRALIGDPRNDENLVVAQTHVQFLKFHNAVVNQLPPNPDPVAHFNAARKVVTQHYQSIVLHDFVPRLVAPEVLDDVMTNGRKFFMPAGVPEGEHPCMPLEFSVAAYRLGHSMIRNAYLWNRVFTIGGLALGTLPLLFEFSGVSGDFSDQPTLPTDWVADFRRLISFPGIPDHPQLNFTRLIDTNLANSLKDLPEFATESQPHRRSLAARNLVRGRQVGLPTGQAVAAKIGATSLTPDEVKSGAHGTVLENHSFHTQTPLWYYILKEAEVQNGGRRLGTVGSRILVETFHGLIEGSQHSILKVQNWKPTLNSNDPNRYTFADLLSFVNDINPLGGP